MEVVFKPMFLIITLLLLLGVMYVLLFTLASKAPSLSRSLRNVTIHQIISFLLFSSTTFIPCSSPSTHSTVLCRREQKLQPLYIHQHTSLYRGLRGRYIYFLCILIEKKKGGATKEKKHSHTPTSTDAEVTITLLFFFLPDGFLHFISRCAFTAPPPPPSCSFFFSHYCYHRSIVVVVILFRRILHCLFCLQLQNVLHHHLMWEESHPRPVKSKTTQCTAYLDVTPMLLPSI